MVTYIFLGCNEFQINVKKYVLSFELSAAAISRDDFRYRRDFLNLKIFNKWFGTIIETTK